MTQSTKPHSLPSCARSGAMVSAAARFECGFRSAAREPSYRLLVFGILAIQAWALRSWLVDDAGISMSYARNLGLGAGLVAQAGDPPVEGYSNPLWVLLLCPLVQFDA